MMAKKNPGGQADRNRRGVKAIVVPLTVEQHTLVQLAAGTFTGRERAVSRFAAAAIEAAAKKRLADVAKKTSRESQDS